MDIAAQFARIFEVIPDALGATLCLVGICACLAARRSMR